MHSTVQRGVALGIAASLLAGSTHAAVVQQAAAPSTAPGGNVDWAGFGNTSDKTRYSPLTQINAGNVGTLGLAWTAQEGGSLSAWETDPVVENGVLRRGSGQ